MYVILLTAVLALSAVAQEEPNELPEPREKKDVFKEFFEKRDIEYHGFYEFRAGTRLLDDGRRVRTFKSNGEVIDA